MIEIVRYNSADKNLWDQFVIQAKNSHFFFERNYLDYHADRFQDHSLLFYEDSKLLAVLPGNSQEKTFVSHGGLTFGGFLISRKMKTAQMLELFDILKTYLKQNGFQNLHYKVMPHIYHVLPAEEDLYALFRHDATLVRRDVSSTINLTNPGGFSGGKRNGIAKAKKNNITVAKTKDFSQFNQILADRLKEKYGATPTHSCDEITLLENNFPENIQLFAAFKDTVMLAGVVVFITETVVHSQYMATTEMGRSLGALDLVLSELIQEIYPSKKYFDFGISTEQQGRYLNAGLISQKEMFGASATMYDTYRLSLET